MLKLEEEFSRIYEETYSSIAGYVIAKVRNVHDTDDILQTIYTSFYIRMCNKGILSVEDALKILYTAAKHEIGRHYQKIKYTNKMIPVFSRTSEDITNYELLYEKFLTQVEVNASKETLEEIWDYIRGKDELTYRIFILHYVIGLTFAECEKVLPCSYSTIIHKVYRTIEKLKKMFKEV